MKQSVRKALLVLLSICLLLSGCLSVMASEAESQVRNVGDGVLQIRMVYETKEGTQVLLKTGSCFLLNEKTVLTNFSTIDLNTEIEEELSADPWNVDFSNRSQVEKNIKYYVVLRRDVTYEAMLADSFSSEQVDFQILTLTSAIQGRTPLTLGDSDKSQALDKVYSLGFPMVPAMQQDVPLYTKDDIDIQEGIINKLVDVMDVPAFQHSALIEDDTYGGPLVNENGYVVGLNSERLSDNDDLDGKYCYAIRINEIKEYLDMFGVTYQEVSDIVEIETEAPETEAPQTEAPQTEAPQTEAPETEPPVDEALIQAKAELNAAIKTANAVDPELYTETSYSLLMSAVESAQELLDQEGITAEDVEDALKTLENEQANLEEAPKMDVKMIALIAVAVVIIIILIVVVVIVSKGSKKKSNGYGTGTTPVAPTQAPRPTAPQPAPTPQPTPAAPMSSGAAETSILTPEVGATDILGAPQGAANAYLIRKKTGEKITITTAHFTIGREMGKVNYCITDNTTVGRVHAVIQRQGAGYVIVDQKSTNGTYVNNSRLAPGTPRTLNNGDSVKLSDEVLEFVMN